MNNQSVHPAQISLILRLLGGGYLMYLAWDLRGSVSDSPLFLVAVIVFAAVGLILVGHSAGKLLRKEYARDSDTAIPEESEETTDE